MPQSLPTFFDEARDAARGAWALVLGRQDAPRYFDFSLRGVIGSLIALVLAVAVSVFGPALLGVASPTGAAATMTLLSVLLFAIQIGTAYFVLNMLGRLDGCAVGVIANDPRVMGGALTLQAARKLERFVDLCDTFHLPIVNIVDQPGVMFGLDAERAGTMGAALRAIGAIEQAMVPWCSVIIRRAFGVGGQMQGPQHGPDGYSLNHRFAWPSARWGSIPIEGGVAAAYRQELADAADPAERQAELEAYYHRLSSPFRTAERFGVVDIIRPSETRKVLCNWVQDAFTLAQGQVGLRLRTMR